MLLTRCLLQCEFMLSDNRIDQAKKGVFMKSMQDSKFEGELLEIEELEPVHLFGTVTGRCEVGNGGEWSCGVEATENT